MRKIIIKAPSSGPFIKLDDIPDEVFSTRLLGDGFAIKTTSNFAVAPIDGILRVVYPLGHAYAIESEDGISIMVHIGLDLYKNGKRYFKILVNQGEKVIAGQPIIKINQRRISRDNANSITPVVFLESERCEILNNKFSFEIEEFIECELRYNHE